MWKHLPIALAGDFNLAADHPWMALLESEHALHDVIGTFESPRAATHVQGGVIDHIMISGELLRAAKAAGTAERLFPSHSMVTVTLQCVQHGHDEEILKVVQPRPLPLEAADVKRLASSQEYWPFLHSEFLVAEKKQELDNMEMLWSKRWGEFLCERLSLSTREAH